MKKRLWRGSTIQSIAVIVLPLTLVLVIVSIGSFQIHQNAMRSLVGNRDERSAMTAASALESEIEHRLYAIQTLSTLANSNPQASLDTILAESQSLMKDFDAGTAFVGYDGNMISTNNKAIWQSLESTPEFDLVIDPKPDGAISAAFTNPLDGHQIVLVSSRTAKAGLLAIGAFSPEKMIQGTLQDIYPSKGHIAIYIIDSNYQILYHSGPATLEGGPLQHPGVGEAFKGQSGTIYMQAGQDEHVVAYSPIKKVSWAIVTEESWETVSSPTLRTSQIVPLIMIPALLLALLAIWFGARQIVRPLQALEARAARLAWGDFKPIELPVGGIAEIRDLQNELAHMAGQLQAAQQSLHSYIGAMTKGQEAERLRLARELHDGTIQSLIALKQRVQLARMALKRGGSSPELKELESLTETTIEELRRTTRALRPIYLEDLGLVAALEMLVSETSRDSTLEIDFRTSGTERRFSSEEELALYRIVQESLNNIVHHAQAAHASLRMEFQTNKLTLEISDDGKGFEVPRTPAEFTPQGHFGLLGLYERTELIGAHLEIVSSPGNGTHLIISLPYPNGVKEETES